MSPDHQQNRFLPIEVVTAVKEVFKHDVEIFYVDDTDIIRVIFSIGTICFTLDLEQGRVYGSSEKEYLMKSLSLDGSHNLFDNELKNFFDYDRDLKRLGWLEIQLSGIFSVISNLYNPDFTDCASSAVEANVEGQLEAVDNLRSGFEPEDHQQDVEARDACDSIDGTVLPGELVLQANPTAQPGGAVLAPVDQLNPYRSAAKAVFDNAATSHQRHQYVWTKKSTYQVVGGAVVGAALAWPIATQILVPFQHKDSITRAVHTTSRRQPLLPTLNAPVVSRPVPAVPACPIYTMTSADGERSIAAVLRRMHRQQPTVFSTYRLNPGKIIALSISPRHHAQVSARNADDVRHTLGATHNYHFGRVVVGDQFTLGTCPAALPVFTHLRDGVVLYSFSLR